MGFDLLYISRVKNQKSFLHLEKTLDLKIGYLFIHEVAFRSFMKKYRAVFERSIKVYIVELYNSIFFCF